MEKKISMDDRKMRMGTLETTDMYKWNVEVDKMWDLGREWELTKLGLKNITLKSSQTLPGAMVWTYYLIETMVKAYPGKIETNDGVGG